MRGVQHNPVNENVEGTLKKPRVLFICTDNSGRSQMAEGYLRKHYGDLFEAGSAGTEVRTVHPLAVLVMDEIGIDISEYRVPSLIDEFFDQGADIVVTVCDSVTSACPFFPGAKRYFTPVFLTRQPARERPMNVSCSSGR